MKKALALTLCLLLCLSLCACGGNSKYDKYADLFDLLESGNYDAAKDKIDQMAGGQGDNNSGDGNTSGDGSNSGNGGSNADKPTTTVTVDLNNWSQYFEIVQVPSVRYNAFDEPEALNTSWEMRVKSAYADKIASIDLAVETLAKGQFVYKAAYDTATKQLNLNVFTEADYVGHAYSKPAPEKEETATFAVKHSTTDYSTPVAEKLWRACSSGGMYVDSVAFSGTVVTADLHLFETVIVTRISGTIQLYS